MSARSARPATKPNSAAPATNTAAAVLPPVPEPIIPAITIQSIKGRQIFDSRGNPTVEADVFLSDDSLHRAAVPSGSPAGLYEALELRDEGNTFFGKGVTKAVRNINDIISPALFGKDPKEQALIDNLMVQQLDGTQSEWGWCKKKLGANAILAVSIAICKAGAAVKNVPLYKHISELAGNKNFVLPVPLLMLSMELMILPTGASSFTEAMKMGTEVYHNLKSVIKKKYGQDAINVGDEGAFAPNVEENKEALELLKEAIEKAGYTGKIVIGIDAAASEFYVRQEMIYNPDFKRMSNDGKVSGDQLMDLYKFFIEQYPVVSIEDPFFQDDWEAYGKFAKNMGSKVQIVGDDFLASSPTRMNRAISEKSCNALLLKVIQIGTVTESIDAVKISKKAGWGVIASQRLGETEDTFISDLAVGLATGQIKAGAPCRSERLAKYNQLLRIEEDLGKAAIYAGAKYRTPCPPY